MAVLQADLTDSSTLTVGSQRQDNSPVGSTWGTVASSPPLGHSPTSLARPIWHLRVHAGSAKSARRSPTWNSRQQKSAQPDWDTASRPNRGPVPLAIALYPHRDVEHGRQASVGQ